MTGPRGWAWWLAVCALAGTVLAGAALIGALVLGWNNPRPAQPPDWQAIGLPLELEAAPGDDALRLLDQAPAEFSFEIVAQPITGADFNGYGLVYRAQDDANVYVFAVGSDGYYAVLKLAGGEETPLVDWQQFPHVRRGLAANRLRVTCAGPICRFYINDEYATQVSDDAYVTGALGLWTRSFDGASVVVSFLEAHAWSEAATP